MEHKFVREKIRKIEAKIVEVSTTWTLKTPSFNSVSVKQKTMGKNSHCFGLFESGILLIISTKRYSCFDLTSGEHMENDLELIMRYRKDNLTHFKAQ